MLKQRFQRLKIFFNIYGLIDRISEVENVLQWERQRCTNQLSSSYQNSQRLLDCVDNKVTSEMNSGLMQDFSREEVFAAKTLEFGLSSENQTLWRLSHNTLAVKNILKRRGMKIDTCCSLCQRLDEDGGHLSLKCKEVKGVWRELNLEAVRCSLSEAGSAREMMEMIFRLEAKTQLTVILLLWLWWDERNKLREEGRRRSALELAYIAAAMADKFQSRVQSSLLWDSRQVQTWNKPQQGKANFLLDAFHAELLGCLAGVKAAVQLGFSKIVLETDASLVKSAVESNEYRLSALGGVITELRLLLMSEFVEARVQVCPRLCNKVADA